LKISLAYLEPTLEQPKLSSCRMHVEGRLFAKRSVSVTGTISASAGDSFRDLVPSIRLLKRSLESLS